MNLIPSKNRNVKFIVLTLFLSMSLFLTMGASEKAYAKGKPKPPAMKQHFKKAATPKAKPKRSTVSGTKKPKQAHKRPTSGLRNQFNTASGARISDKFNQAAKKKPGKKKYDRPKLELMPPKPSF